MMNRRTLFGAVAGSVIAGPTIAEALATKSNAAVLSASGDEGAAVPPGIWVTVFNGGSNVIVVDAGTAIEAGAAVTLKYDGTAWAVER